MPNKVQTFASEPAADDVPLVKRLRRSALSSAAEEQARHCQELFHALREFQNEEGRWLCEGFFRYPSKKSSPEYHKVITNPMDITTIHQKINDDEYANVEMFMSDVQLMIENAKLYYDKDSQPYQDACNIWKMLLQFRTKQEENLESVSESSCSPTPSSRSLRSNSPSRSLKSWERVSPASETESASLQMLEDVLANLLTVISDDSKPACRWFKVVPPKQLYPEYYACIEEPIDLRTMAARIRDHTYKSLSDMETDLELLCSNARAFNEPQSIAAQDASLLSTVFSRRKYELLQMGKRSLLRESTDRSATLVENLLCFSFDMLELCSPVEDANDLPCLDGTAPMMQLYCFLRFWREPEREEPYFSNFVRLPDRRVFPKYYEEVVRPVSFYTINRNIKEGLYGSLAMLVLDFCLMGRNVMNCYAEESPIYKKALRLKALAIGKAAELCPFLQGCYADGRPSRSSRERAAFNRSSPGKHSSKPMDKTLNSGANCETLEDRILEYKTKLMRIYFTVVGYTDSDGRRLSIAFMEKPSKKKYPDYYQVIPEPIDLRTIRASIEADRYASSNAMAADFDLLFENAKHYNEDSSVIFQDAITLSNVFSDALANVCPKNIELPKASTNRTKRICAYKRERGSCRKRSGSFSSDSSAQARKKRRSDERDSKLWQLYNHIREFTDPKGRVLSKIFVKLPSRMEYPDYYEVIRKPIDMQKIQNRISSNHYESLDALVADVALMFDNACKYNDPESQIYKDALMLQRLLLLKKSELQADEPSVLDVQRWVQEMLTNIFLEVCNHQDEEGRNFADSLYEFASGADDQGKLFTLDQIKRNIDKKRYRRLDRFQDDMFAMLRNVRESFPPDSQVFEDSVELQSRFIRVRNELTKEGDTFYSPALSYTEKDLNAEVQEQKSSSVHKEYKAPAETADAMAYQDGQEATSVVVRDVVYNIGDFVYVRPTEAGTEPHIMCLKRIWETGESGEVLAYGNWFYRPSDTFHLATRKFLDHEVFITDFFDKIDTQRIIGKCCVMFVKSFFKYRPVGFMDEDVYVCESKYLGRVKHFKKLKTWDVSSPESNIVLEERSVPLEPIRAPFTFANKESTDAVAVPSADDEDSDTESQTSVLQVDRCELVLKSDPPAETVEYEQACYNNMWVKLGDCVYLTSCGTKPNILRIERIWKSNEETWVSGVTFVFPCQIEHEPTRLFCKNEVFAVESRTEYPMSKISGLCSVLSPKSYSSFRLAEIPEADVFLCDWKAIPTEDQKLMVPENHEGRFRFKNIRFVNDILEDELFYFEKPFVPAKEPSPFLMERVISFDNSTDEMAHNSEAIHSDFKMLKDLHFTPKLTARSKSGYILFSAVVRKRIMAENPDCSFGDISKIVGSEWKKLSDEEKKRYEEEAQRIADQRAKADMVAGQTQLLPGQTRVYCCRWRECDYQFETVDQLNDHITSAHTSQIGKVGDDQYVCLWLTCSKYRKEGKPFPSLPRLHRHIKEKHLPSSVKCMYPQSRGKHYIPLPTASCADNGPSRVPIQPVNQNQSPFAPTGPLLPPARFHSAPQEQAPQPATSQTPLATPSQYFYDGQGNVYTAQPSGQPLMMYQLPPNAQAATPAHPLPPTVTSVPTMKPPVAPIPLMQPGCVPQSSYGSNPPIDPGRTIVRSAKQEEDDLEMDAPTCSRRVFQSEAYVKYLEEKSREQQTAAPEPNESSKTRRSSKWNELIVNAYNALLSRDSANISKGLIDAISQYLK
uniref:Protein polybromo-1 n=1 Tax=Trichuris muris TaxID=70415 RepID=A0A5S6Q9E8_TRIMR